MYILNTLFLFYVFLIVCLRTLIVFALRVKIMHQVEICPQDSDFLLADLKGGHLPFPMCNRQNRLVLSRSFRFRDDLPNAVQFTTGFMIEKMLVLLSFYH